ncbi:tRNA lysidine(34) synthetase TilS [Gilvimarinus sp. DA14]|uniref:tRNA lysidine(34) synthetase TilS n=1 Tax=Gilvimarinus sp. DA14 TaxID=2956798 RepID=UPI0020B6902C|nr:tRNA lysidine(34) synthetase TilS [Gilvimarinus sp. DA14]UTF60120.1 tRNA lysidine(34) synthetase TilS [Gilvimarinus sp. DA14]
MTHPVVRTLQDLAFQHHASRWLVGFSGGLDSTVLLHSLSAAQLSTPVVAVHVHHGLSPNADSWQRHCKAVCDSLEVPLLTQRLGLHSPTGNLEERARQARYQAIKELTQPGDVVLLGHHRDDQAETLLYRLMRGAGVKGLAAMGEHRRLGNANLWRPLLHYSRAELLAYAREHGLQWIEDESNQQLHFDRNYLRQQVLPALTERWPEASKAMTQSAEHCREAQSLLTDLAILDSQQLAERPEPGGCSVDLAHLRALPPRRQKNYLRYWLDERFGVSISRQAQVDIEQQLLGEGTSVAARIFVAQVQLCCFADRLYALDARAQWAPGADEPSLPWQTVTKPLALPGGDCLSLKPATCKGIHPDYLTGKLEVRWRQGGERCQPAGRGHSQTLKKLLQEYQVPTWLRPRVPLLFIDGELAAVGDYWVNQAFTGEGARVMALQWSFEPRQSPTSD